MKIDHGAQFFDRNRNFRDASLLVVVKLEDANLVRI